MIEDKNNKFIKKIKETFILLLPVLLVLVFLIPVPYYVQMGGGTIDLNKKISIKEEKESGYYGALYVREAKGNVLTYLLSFIIPSFDKERIIQEETTDSQYREEYFFKSSLDDAIKIAFEYTGKDIKIKESKLNVIYIDKNAKVQLKTGDRIIKVSGKNITNYEEMINTLNDSSDPVLITVIRDDKEIVTKNDFININNYKKLGIVVSEEVKYITNPEVKFNFQGKESGSSGGLMIALSIYDKLTDKDLTNSKKIVGTGSIDRNGNVLEIDGIKHKLWAANKKRADIVFVPWDNKEEAETICKEKGYDFKLVAVKNFKDAVKYLESKL